MRNDYKINYSPQAARENIIQGENYRFTILTNCLVRLEYSADGIFEDRATQIVVNRDFPPADYTAAEKDGRILIRTAALLINYDKREFSKEGLSIEVKDLHTSLHDTWHYGKKAENLKGTARTLDNVNGREAELGEGIIAKNGYALLDDSTSLIQTPEGWVEPGIDAKKDIYFFGYGHDYKRALKDFYHLCGKNPMLPRFALGNWWSRYYPYSQEEYLKLMDRFASENLPFSVAVLDMDWHLVDVDAKYGTGWTGFTWNTELFPQREEFIAKLHKKGMKITLNLHPSDGIRGFEEAYPIIAEHRKVNVQEEEPVMFDASDPEFMQYYFQDVLHPLEKEGVDFWWIDWQQGSSSKIRNLDPLWILNHFHYLDNGKDGKRPMILSRYAGPGSHRYPVGFSGDTVISWESLEFQPYFTATASNIGYSWWSHDIGGHMLGYKDEELLVRWIQFGTFSPIMRLHSTNCVFNSKEPWRHTKETAEIMGHFLRLRHRLIPYLYTMNWRNYKENLPLIQPLYYEYPECEEAYQHQNEYYLGTQLLVMPVTSKTIAGLHRAKVRMWIPEGIWYDIFSCRVYSGNRTLDMYRELNRIPVLAKAGSILPMTDQIFGNAASVNPEQLHLYLYLGAEGEFLLYEDDGETAAYGHGNYAETKLQLSEKEKGMQYFIIHAPTGDTSFVPESRRYLLEVAGASMPIGDISVRSGNRKTEAQWKYENRGHRLIIEIPDVCTSEDLHIEMPVSSILQNSVEEDIFEFLDSAEISYPLKEQIYREVLEETSAAEIISRIQARDVDRDLMGAMIEMLTAYI